MTRGSNVKKKFVLAALVAAAIQVPAMAGFVDMTVPGGHPYSNASQVRVIIDDAYQTPQWDQPIAPQNSYVSLPEALAILLPPAPPRPLRPPSPPPPGPLGSPRPGCPAGIALPRAPGPGGVGGNWGPGSPPPRGGPRGR